MEDITFSNGTTIPSGTHLAVASVPMHLDDRHYKNASEFDAFRFLFGQGAEDSLQKSRLASTNRLYLVFGHGNRAWYVYEPPEVCVTIANCHVSEPRSLFCFHHVDHDDGSPGAKLRYQVEGRSAAARPMVFDELLSQPDGGDHVQATFIIILYYSL